MSPSHASTRRSLFYDLPLRLADGRTDQSMARRRGRGCSPARSARGRLGGGGLFETGSVETPEPRRHVRGVGLSRSR